MAETEPLLPTSLEPDATPELDPFAHRVPVLRHSYALGRAGKSTVIVAGNGRPVADLESASDHDFGGWAYPRRDTEGDDRIVSLWLPRTRHAYILIPFQTLYVIVLWSLMVVKIVSWSFRAYDMFFTNWSWTIQALFYTVDLLCFLDRSRYTHYLLLLVWWWPTLITVVAVFLLVQLVILDNPILFTAAAKQYGDGDMILGHELVHIIPVFMIMGWGLARGTELSASIAMLQDTRGSYGMRLPLYIAINYLYPILVIFSYVTVNNYQKVYHVGVNPAVAVFSVLLLYTILYAFCLWVVFPRDDSHLPDDKVQQVVLRHEL